MQKPIFRRWPVAWLLGLLQVLSQPGWACRVCRPRVQATIHGPDYAQNVVLLLLPVALLLLVGVGLFFATTLTRRFTTSHD